MKITNKQRSNAPWILLLGLAMFTFLVQAQAKTTIENASLIDSRDKCKTRNGLFNFYIADMGAISNYETSFVKDINNNSVSYGDAWSQTPVNRAVAFRHEGEQYSIGMSPIYIANAQLVQVESANDLGEIVGSKSASSAPESVKYIPFHFDGAATTVLNFQPDGSTFTLAQSINNKGEIVGSAYGTGNSSVIYWQTKNSTAKTLSNGFAVAINNEGRILFNNNNSALISGKEDRITALPHLSTANFSQGVAINNRGTVLGVSRKLSPSIMRPVFWQTSVGKYGPAQEIPVAPDTNGTAIDINNQNYVLLRFGAKNYLTNILTGVNYELPNPPNSSSFTPVSINDKCEIVGAAYTPSGTRSFKYIPL